jgi:hypothetical protein
MADERRRSVRSLRGRKQRIRTCVPTNPADKSRSGRWAVTSLVISRDGVYAAKGQESEAVCHLPSLAPFPLKT